jgi:DHA2 family multidrug resistance protein-like MFS transporter
MMIETNQSVPFQGNDRVLYGIILGVITFWLFAQMTSSYLVGS